MSLKQIIIMTITLYNDEHFYNMRVAKRWRYVMRTIIISYIGTSTEMDVIEFFHFSLLLFLLFLSSLPVKRAER